MKKFLVAVITILMCISMTACSLPFGIGQGNADLPDVVEPIDPITDTPTDSTGDSDITTLPADTTITDIGLTTEPEVTPEPVVTEEQYTSNRKKSFQEQHPYLFAFRFDGVNAYIDESVYSQPEVTESALSEMKYTDINAEGLPSTLRVKGILAGYTFSSDVNSQQAVFLKTGSESDKITVEFVPKANIESERHKVPDEGIYSVMTFDDSKYNMSMENVESVQQSVLKYALRDGTEGSVDYGLVISVKDGGYIVIRNANLSSGVYMDSLKTVYKNCLEWVTE